MRASALIGLSVLALSATFAQAGEPYALPVTAQALPDRIVLSPGADPAHQMAVAYRTNTDQTASEAELALSLDGPNFAAGAVKLTGTAVTMTPQQGAAIYHHVRFDGLKPDTAYAYRVKGAGGWSEWLQFHTAKEGFAPFRFLYFGDIQHNILPVGSRAVRQAFLTAGSPALALHAGDLVNQHALSDADGEWGAWTAAGGYAYAMVPQVPAAGNHEYIGKALSPFWSASFALPSNGPDPVKASAYTLTYQDVRFVLLDATAALDGGALDQQTAWLDATLKANKARWTVVMYHQPIFKCFSKDDEAALKTAWKPVFDRYNVDLVLQGHEHCYSRRANPENPVKAAKTLQGPVYLVSSAGGKNFNVTPESIAKMDRIAADTQFFQVIDIAADRIRVQAITAAGRVYDDFAILRDKKGKRLSVAPNLPPQRLCTGDKGPDGLPCLGTQK